jgi:hypothetical protein
MSDGWSRQAVLNATSMVAIVNLRASFGMFPNPELSFT